MKICVPKVLLLIAIIIAVCSVNLKAEVNYDTAWTFVYDGGKGNSGSVLNDKFYDVKSLPSGACVCVGLSGDTTNSAQSLLIKLDLNGNILQKKLYKTNNTVHSYYNGQSAHSVNIAKNGDLLIGGVRWGAPWIMRLDSLGNIKWSAWYYDSTKGVTGSILLGNGNVNSIRETSRGTIICAVGDEYPNNGNSALNNYAAFLELDSAGKIIGGNEWDNETGYVAGGFYIDEVLDGNYLLSGNQTIFYLDTSGSVIWKKNYTMMLEGVGSMTNNISRAKMLRNGTLMAAGQAYEWSCWTRYKQLYYDTWRTPISYVYGTNDRWDTAGAQRGSDAMYDFTQLNDGKLVFTGTKATTIDTGLWVFVTDSVGKEILWEKQFNLPGADASGYELKNLLPLSVCATPDNGFTVVGDNNTAGNNHNAFAMHFVLKDPSKTIQDNSLLKSTIAIRTFVNDSKITFAFDKPVAVNSVLSVYNATGKRVASLMCIVYKKNINHRFGTVRTLGKVFTFIKCS